MENYADRIGTLNADGTVKVHPKLSLLGAEYDHTQSRLGIDKTHFVILDRWLSQTLQDNVVLHLLEYLSSESDKAKRAIKDLKADES